MSSAPATTAVYGLVSTVTFTTGLELERGEHVSAHHSQAAGKAVQIVPISIPDVVEVGTVGIVLVVVGVIGWSCIAFWLNGRWHAIFTPSTRRAS